MNKVILVGNLCKDVDLTTTTSGISVARFALVVMRRYTNENGEREADFINCVAWRTTAENLQKYCHKGDKISVVGAIQTRSYDGQDGTKKYVTEVVADEIEFIKTKKSEDNSEAPTDLVPAGDIDDLPF